MKLRSNNNLEVNIFNVGRGLSILIKTPQNLVVIYDLGSTDSFSPINEIYKYPHFFDDMKTLNGCKISQCIISHPHLDHISDLTNDNTSFIAHNTAYITCQNDKAENSIGHKIDFSRINNPGENCEQVENYKSLYKKRQLPLVTINPKVDYVNFQMGYYYLPHKKVNELFPKDDQEYTNSLSIVLYLSFNGNSIVIPGDINPDAFELILNGKCEKRFTNYNMNLSNSRRAMWASSTTNEQPILKDLLKTTNVAAIVAPHHGLESGYCQKLFEILDDKKPDIILISEGKHYKNSGSIAKEYQDGTTSTGLSENNKTRWSLTTRNDGHIKIVFDDKTVKYFKFNNYKDMFK